MNTQVFDPVMRPPEACSPHPMARFGGAIR